MTKHFLKVALIVLGTTIVGAAQTNLAGVEDPRIIVSPQRQLYNGIPVHVPLGVAVKNLSSDRWVHDIEVEVTNTSEKPIYYMHMYLMVPGVKTPSNQVLSYLLMFGRAALMDLSEKVETGDVPLAPGETHVFKLSESQARTFEVLRKEGQPDAKYLKLAFQCVNFGDATGFVGTSGEAVPVNSAPR